MSRFFLILQHHEHHLHHQILVLKTHLHIPVQLQIFLPMNLLHEVDSLVRKFVIGREYEGVFLKPKFGDASGVRGAARLGRSATY